MLDKLLDSADFDVSSEYIGFQLFTVKMFAMIYITLSCILVHMTHSLNVHTNGNTAEKSRGFRRLFDLAEPRLSANAQVPEQMSMYDMLAQQVREEESRKHKKHRILRNMVTVQSFTQAYVNTEHSKLVLNELKDTEAAGKKAAILDHAFVEKRGINDFLVFNPGLSDPFVTIIPNDIYYNVGPKICANWLDECSVQGIRARLLHRVRSPYK